MMPALDTATGAVEHEGKKAGAFVVVPYTLGMLREETVAALNAWDGAYVTYPLDAFDPYAYATAFADWWHVPMDLLVIEQDMVPSPEQIDEILACPEIWCTAKYHQGHGVYRQGLGFMKIARRFRRSYQHAGGNIARDPSGRAPAVTWQGLNESIQRHLNRLGYEEHVHDFTVTHLHYPEADRG